MSTKHRTSIYVGCVYRNGMRENGNPVKSQEAAEQYAREKLKAGAIKVSKATFDGESTVYEKMTEKKPFWHK